MKKMSVRSLIISAIFTALLAVFAQISIPFWPANICLTLMAIELCLLMFGLEISFASTLVYILLGVIGVPVFTGFKAGPTVLFGMTGGYIVGYLLFVLLAGLLLKHMKQSIPSKVIALIAGLAVCYLFGTIWFMVLTGRGLIESLALCVLPYLPGDAVKIILAIWLSGKLAPVVKRFR